MAWSRLLLDQDRNHALVMGASIAGPMIASVMINRFDEAAARDRDELPEMLLPPCSVPKKHYVRLLLERGRKIMSEYLPKSWPRWKAEERKEPTSASSSDADRSTSCPRTSNLGPKISRLQFWKKHLGKILEGVEAKPR